MPTLVVEKGTDKGKSIPITVNQTVIIGRDTSTALPLRDHMTSRMHFKIEAKEDGFWVHDLESMNGTYLNGAKIKLAMKLEVGDLIKAGETLFTFLEDGSGATTMSGQTLAGYRIIERVGRGGMGTVYRAEQVDLQREVALKIISDEHVKDKDFVDLFIHEARAAAKLNHPNIVQVYDVKRHGESYFFSMEYVSGGSVQEMLNKQRKLPVDECVRMILDAARGLEYAHKKGIIHRDVKPDNFMLSETGSVKIADMGLARGVDEKVGPEEETSVIGTPHYIAPEQVLGRPADFRSDIYSLGATMFRMVTGVTPFHAPGIRELVNRKVREEAPAAHEHNSDIPKALSDVVARMMSREPEKRYQTMGEVVAALEKFQRGGAEGTGELRYASRPIEMLGGGKRALALAAVALVVIGGSVGAWIAFSGPPDAGPNVNPPRATDPEAARQALNLAMLFDRTRMDKSSPRSIEEGIREYQAVAEKYPGTPEAAKALELKKALDRMHREVAAERKFQLLEAEEIGAHRRVVEAFQGGSLNLAPMEQATASLRAFAADPAAKGTPAGERALAAAEEIVRWRERVTAQRDRFEKTVEKAKADGERGRFREAWTALAEIRDGVRRLETEGGATKERYRELFYDDLAGREVERVAMDARMAWTKTDAEARALARDRAYEAAIKVAEAAIRDSIDEVALAAKALKDSLESEWAMVVRREVEEKEAKDAEGRRKALDAFAAESRFARDLVLKYDFKGAYLRMKSLQDMLGMDELKPRLERRVAELERVAHLKDTLLSVISARNNPYRFKKEFNLQGIEGVIEEADERGLVVGLNVGGTTQHTWSQFGGSASFLKFLRDHWKYNVNQRKDAGEQCDIIAFCVETGLYEDAIAEIDQVLAAFKDPGYTGADTLRKFCEEYRARLEKGESAEHEEIEAEKRLERLDGFLRRDDFGKARAEIEALRARFGRSKTFIKAQPEVEKALQRIEKEGGDALKKSFREDKHRLLLARLAEEKAAAKRAQSDVVQRLGRIEDLFQRNAHLGAVYAAAGEWKTSTERLLDAKRAGEQMLARREVGAEFLPSLGQVYGDLLRNATLQREKSLLEAVKTDGSRRFVNPDTKMEEPWWTGTVDWVSSWSETILPAETLKAAKLREEVRAVSDDPQKIWTLAQSLAEGTSNLLEARGYYAYLLENHPDFPQVQNGNCLYRYAEILFAAREVKEAIRRYDELKMVAKEHPKLGDAVPNGVKKRLDEAYKLLGKMGYAAGKK
ncbi:MAG TPA: protein kinase [Planctomycetota bacterium]